MIVREFYETRADGVNLYHLLNLMITKQLRTGQHMHLTCKENKAMKTLNKEVRDV